MYICISFSHGLIYVSGFRISENDRRGKQRGRTEERGIVETEQFGEPEETITIYLLHFRYVCIVLLYCFQLPSKTCVSDQT